jgi:hypothetical protein
MMRRTGIFEGEDYVNEAQGDIISDWLDLPRHCGGSTCAALHVDLLMISQYVLQRWCDTGVFSSFPAAELDRCRTKIAFQSRHLILGLLSCTFLSLKPRPRISGPIVNVERADRRLPSRLDSFRQVLCTLRPLFAMVLVLLRYSRAHVFPSHPILHLPMSS